MKNFFIKKWSDLFIYLSKTVREWFENGSRKVRQMCAAWVMLRGKLVNCAKSVMQIFATYATYASAIFVGKESNESTVRYALWSRISLIKPLQNPYKTLTKPLQNPYKTLTKPLLASDLVSVRISRLCLASLICLCMLTIGSGNVWAQTTTTYTFSSKSWAASPANWTKGKDGNQMQSGRGIQVTTGTSGANGTSPKSFTNVSKVVVTYSTNASAGAGSIAVKIGSNTASSKSVTTTGGTTDRTLTYNFSPNQTGSVKVTVTCTTNSIYVKSVAITEAASCTSITPSLSYASVGGTTLTVGSSSSGSPTITGNTGSGTVTYSSNNTSVATVNSSTGVVTAVAAGNATITASIAAEGVYCDGSATANFTITVPAYTVQFSTGTGNPTVSSRTEASGGAGITLPAGPTPACSGDGWVFMGWKETSAQSSTTTAPDLLAAGSTYHPASNCTLYAVYYKQADSNPNYYTKVTTSSDNLTSGQYVIYANGEAMNNALSGSKIAGKSVSETSSGSGIISTTDADIIWTLYKNGTNYQLYNAGVSKYLEVTGENSLSLPTSSKGFTLYAFNTSTGQVSLKSVNKTSYQFQYYNGNFSAYGSQSTAIYFYKRGGTYNSNPTCCTALGSVTGNIGTNTPTSVTLTWSAVSGAEKYQVKVPGSSSHNDWTDAVSGVSVTKSCGTAYTAYFRAIDTNGSHCAEGPESTLAIPAVSWTVSPTISNGTASPAIPGTTCNGFSTTVTAAAGYDLPSTITVSNASHTWNQATGALTVNSVIGNVSITITPTVHTYTITYKDKGGGAFTGTQTDPPTTHIYGTATTLKIPTKENYSFGGWFTESDCESGAVGNASSATLGATAFTADITLYAKWVANTHTVTYASNGADGGSVPVDANSPYNHGANVTVLGNTGELTKTHYSFGGWSDGVTTYAGGDNFDISDDVTLSAVWNCAEYVNVSAGTPSHGTFSLSATGSRYTCDGAQVITVTSSANTGYEFSDITQTGVNSGVTIDNNAKTVTYAQWANGSSTINVSFAAKSYTVTLDKQSGSGGSENVSATYDAAMPSATMPTRSGYTFGGYYGSEGGAGTQYYAADGSSAHTWDVANATTIYAQWTAKNYTITLDNEGADSGKEGTASISVTFDANTNLTSAITKPVRDGYKFGGYYTEEDGSGTQIIDENGNVIASVASYTGSTKQWIYANDIELHAYWKPSYTVTWSVNGETTTEQVVSGEQVAALPTAPTSSDCDDAKVFVGWRSTAIDGVSAANPGSIFTTQAASPAITGDVTFYAVFADESGGDFTRVTSTSQLVAGQKIIMGYEATANSGVIVPVQSGALNGTLLYMGTTAGSVGYGTIDMSSLSNSDNYVFTLHTGHNSGYWSFEMSGTNTGKYLSYNGKNSITSANSITSDGKTDFSIALVDDNVAHIYNKYGSENQVDSKYYYKMLSYNYNNGTTRAALYNAVQTGEFVLYIANPLVYSNYVTSCSSCDADATFTNTTPVVSAIDCDAATLTMTDGLETLGADGCNVSDYGFVIGTTDNPTIGGVGVTKLQAGTTNPTLGADFTQNATGLSAGTHYYIRAYAINRHGTAYSGSQNFWTKGVSSIAITTAPTKTKYVEGETFDKTGMVVTATMADGSTEDVTSDCTFSPSLSTKLSDQTAIRATYSLCEVDKTADQAINVYTLTVTEGTNDTYGTAGKTDNKVTVTGLGDHKTYTVTVTSGNADKIDNGDGTYTITNATGNVTVRVDYADAVQVKVYYKVDGVTVTGLTRDVYQSETTTLPSASDLATAMTAQGMEIPDDSYPNFVGWSETEFGAQTSEPTLVTGTPTINAEKTYYAVYTNLNKTTIDVSVITSVSYPGSEQTKTVNGTTFKYHYILKGNYSGTLYLQFKSNASEYGRIYNSSAMDYLIKLEAGYYNSDSNVKVYACSSAGTTTGSAISAASRESTDPYVYTFPANTSYFMVKGDNSTTYKPSYLTLYHASATVEYMTQFCTRYDITGVTKSGTAVTGGTLSSNYNSACEGKSVELEAVVSTGYQFNGWTIKKTADLTQDVTSTLLGANASSLTPPAFSMPAYAITVSASITEKEVTGWTWKQALPDATQIAIPSKVVLYVGQRAEFDLIEYDPSDVLAKKKGYGVTKEDAYLTQNAKAADYYKADAKAAVESTTLTLTSTSNGSVQEVINIQIKALPSVTFEDHVHGVVFSAVAATIDEMDKRVVYLTKTTPTTSDFSGTTYNTCEEQHEHLVGWIESGWADEHPNATHSEIAGAGAGVFYTAGASIDVEAQNGKTFYAVWSKIE